MKAQQFQTHRVAKEVTMSSGALRRQRMAENLVRRWPRDRTWSFSFGHEWATRNGFDPKSFQELLRKTGIKMGFGSDRERKQAFDLVRSIPMHGSDYDFKRRARAVGQAHDLPLAAIDEAVDVLVAMRSSRVP